MPSKSVLDSLWRFVVASNEGTKNVKREIERIMDNGREELRTPTGGISSFLLVKRMLVRAEGDGRCCEIVI